VFEHVQDAQGKASMPGDADASLADDGPTAATMIVSGADLANGSTSIKQRPGRG
jgi:hypothetical protein